ncbi:hypothetical protein [Solirubrum puertoriconensis]|uniref:Uncharacterized protein n=1 Tax=Solirubrum puertoriconensis TaxID=1751427 RepID=A0A9X0HLY6_SOLP1|nr:hypothetical protein [Solirubrum puertoriconensis]KUG08306.1 hypothetical protein ASU33_09025 [Solirubrum puertoriconensis]
MKFAAFAQLPLGQQTEHLLRTGHHLADRAEHGCRLQLYALEDFYAEVWRLVGEERVLFINLFQKPALLQNWLDSVRLPEEL